MIGDKICEKIRVDRIMGIEIKDGKKDGKEIGGENGGEDKVLSESKKEGVEKRMS